MVNKSLRVIRKLFRLSSLTGLMLLLSLSAYSTTIVPFPNIGEMAVSSDAVVVARANLNFEVKNGQYINYRTSFTVIDVVKGPMKAGATLELQAWKNKFGEIESTVYGDPSFAEGSTYLIFLSDEGGVMEWQPMMLAYGLFEEKMVDNELVFVPSRESLEIEAIPGPDGIVAEPMEVYSSRALISELKIIVKGLSKWNRESVRASDEINQQVLDAYANPSHCTYLVIGGNNSRYTNFPSNDIVIHSENDGDNSYANPADVHGFVSNAIGELSGSYAGTNYNYSGLKDYSPNCVGGGAQGGNFLSVIGARASIVIYNDPCNQIPAFSTSPCRGTIAVGGLYTSGTHTYDGDTWSTGYTSFLIMNDNLGPNGNSCYTLTAANYETVLIHELTHGLGIGHIAGSGTANMNPSCCVDIKPLDEQCLDYTYDQILPVDLISFSVKKKSQSVQLNWSTASEVNNDYFMVERSLDGVNFESIGQVMGKGNSKNKADYIHIDLEPYSGINYYRLKQVDYNGDYQYSDMRFVHFEILEDNFSIYPNPFYNNVFNVSLTSEVEEELILEVIDVTGSTISNQSQFLRKGINKIPVYTDDLPQGVYWVRMRYGSRVIMEQVVKL